MIFFSFINCYSTVKNLKNVNRISNLYYFIGYTHSYKRQL